MGYTLQSHPEPSWFGDGITIIFLTGDFWGRIFVFWSVFGCGAKCAGGQSAARLEKEINAR